MRVFRISSCLFITWLILTPVVSQALPSVVSVSGRRLMVAKRQTDGTLGVSTPYTIKGVGWDAGTRAPAAGVDPFHPGNTTAYGFFLDWTGRIPPQGHEVFPYWLSQEIAAHYAADIPLIAQMNANTVRVFVNFGTNSAVYQPILDTLYNNGIMVVMTVAGSSTDITSNSYSTIVNLYKDHPAILMWSLGNEWNYTNFGFPDRASAITALNAAVAAIKALDANHPVSSILGYAPADLSAIVPQMTGVDIWGLNTYMGPSFLTLFTFWQGLSTKPFYFSEFGTDSYRTLAYTNVSGLAQVTSGSEDRLVQASFEAGLWKEIAANLSATNAALTCAGGAVFNFNDEIYKVGNPNVGLGSGLIDYYTLGSDGLPNHSYESYNPDGFILTGSHPDNISNEEYYGLVTADRVPKLSYGTFKHYYAGVAPQISAGSNRTVAVGVSVALNGSRVDDGLPISLMSSTWTRTSGPGTVTFANANALQTTAVFSAVGTYGLSLSATDGLLQSVSNVTFTVAASVPVVIDSLSATPNPVTGTQTTLSAAYHGGTSPYTYTWTQPSGTSLNNPSAASPVVTFSQSGSYTLMLILQDAAGYSTSRSITVPVNPTGTTVVVTPGASSMNVNQTYPFTASSNDQFGIPLTTQPTFTWSVTPAGATINSSGQFTATSAGAYTVRATAGSLSGTVGVYAKAVLPTHIRTLYSDKGAFGDVVAACANSPICTWAGGTSTFEGNWTGLTPVPEAKTSFYATGSSWTGWGIFFNAGNRDFSAFSSGQLRFWVYTNNADLKVDIEHTSGSKNSWSLSSIIGSRLNQWVPISLSLSGYTLSDLYSPFEITSNSGATFYVDNVRLVDSTVSPIFAVGIYNVSDNQSAGQITFGSAVAGTGWTRADQYLQLEIDSPYQAWGVQIYTDNKATDASPRYTGVTGSNPAGLVDTVNSSQTVSMAWCIKPNGITPPATADPNNAVDVNSFQWLYIKDRQTPDIPQLNTTAFVNGDYYVTARSNNGNQYASGPSDYGPEDPPEQIYFQANFMPTYAQRTYRTSTLRIEFFQP
jgi:hypothetical protein